MLSLSTRNVTVQIEITDMADIICTHVFFSFLISQWYMYTCFIVLIKHIGPKDGLTNQDLETINIYLFILILYFNIHVKSYILIL
jgi:hypothetical protein